MNNWMESLGRNDPELFIQAMHAANDGITITDYRRKDNPIVFVNNAFEKMTNYTSKEILFQNCRFLQGNDRNQKGLEVIRKAVKEGTSCRVDLRNYKKDGTMFWNELSIAPLRNKENQITHFVGIQKDITKQRRFEELLFSQTLEDPLTHLLNRRGFDLKAKHMLSLSKDQQFNVLLVMIDIDNFKTINDCYGHSKGDELLIEVSQFMQENKKEHDVIARYGGDEFILLFAEKDSPSFGEWTSYLEKKMKDLSALQGIPFSLSIGKTELAFSVKKNLTEAIQEADSDLYKIKKEKKAVD